MDATTAVRRQLAVFVGLPGRGEIGREEILQALRRAGHLADQRRQKAAEAVASDKPAKDRMRFEFR